MRNTEQIVSLDRKGRRPLKAFSDETYRNTWKLFPSSCGKWTQTLIAEKESNSGIKNPYLSEMLMLANPIIRKN